jgi:restriction system protein
MGDLSLIAPIREAFKEKYASVFPEEKVRSVAASAGRLYTFVCEAKIGDYVVYPSKTNRDINIGQIESDYFYNSDEREYAQQRKVKWIKKALPRTAFSKGALYESGSLLSFFSIKNYPDAFLSALDKNFKANEIIVDEDETVAQAAAEIVETTKDFIIKELSKESKGYDLEDFVANLLNAMGYRTEISPRGGDRGKDIIAYKDELPPRIIVQVKSQDSNVKEDVIHSLRGVMREGDYGLFVALSKYTKNAEKFLKDNPIIRGIDGYELSDLIIKHYDKLDDKYKKMIPLKKVYIPVVDE